MNTDDGRVRRTWKSLNHRVVGFGRDPEDHLVWEIGIFGYTINMIE